MFFLKCNPQLSKRITEGMAADSTSDWNAPAEHWGNYEEPPALVAPTTLQKEQPKILRVHTNHTSVYILVLALLYNPCLVNQQKVFFLFIYFF